MKYIPKGLTRTVARQVLTTKRNSPHIFFAVGVAGVVGGTFLACRATLKLEETLEEIDHDLEDVKAMKERAADPKDEIYTDREYYKDLGYVYGKSAKKLAHLYGPSIAIGTVSIACLTGSHVQLARRNAALTATVAAVSKAYEDYRGRVREELGEKKELDIYRAVRDEKVEIDGKNQTVKIIDPNGLSVYARIFDEGNPNFVKNAEMNRIFLQAQQNYFNHRLHAYGHVFLNEVYDSLGFERSQAGQVVGWVLDGEGDSFVDFGMFEASASEFMNGYEPRVVLDFNVDGVVYDKF